MSVQDIADLVTKIGLPAVALIFIGLGIWKGVWPLVVEQFRGSQAERLKLVEAIESQKVSASKDREAASAEANRLAIERLEERNRFMVLLDDQADSVRKGDAAIVEAIGTLTSSILQIQVVEADNTRKIIQAISDMAERGKKLRE